MAMGDDSGTIDKDVGSSAKTCRPRRRAGRKAGPRRIEGKHPPSTAVLTAADWRGAQAA